MGSEAERQDTKKAMAYDLFLLLNQTEKDTYTVDEIKQLVTNYISASTSK